MPLIKHGTNIENEWIDVADDESLPADGAIVLSSTRWQAERAALAGHNGRLGIRLAADEDPATIRDDLDRFDLVVLDFPKFNDGRAFSQARMIR